MSITLLSHNSSVSTIRHHAIRNGDPKHDEIVDRIAHACAQFSYERDGVLLNAFQGKEMDKDTFRDQLRRGLGLKITPEEMDLVLELFDCNGNGKCDGAEFLVLFYRFRFEYRSKLLTERITAEKRIKEAAIERMVKRNEEYEQKVAVSCNPNYTEEDKKRALDKITKAAVKYDRLMPGTVQLNAFDGQVMNPKVFKEQLKLVFNIKLTPEELGALMDVFDRTGSGTVNCAEFLVTFFRKGFEERAKIIRSEREKKQQYEEERAKRKAEKEKELEMKNSLEVNYNFTPEDRDSAIAKLSAAAKLYDKYIPGAPNMNAFDGAVMEPFVFKDQLQRTFKLKLTPQELGALVHEFDHNKDGNIDCAEFIRIFQKIGYVERQKEIKELHEKEARLKQKREEMKRREEEEAAMKNSLKVSYDFTEADAESAISKLTEAAWKYDRNMPGAVGLDAFYCQSMAPHEFKEQLKRVLSIHLNPKELGALMAYFDKNKENRINCTEFIIQFIKVGFSERSRRRQEWIKLQTEKSLKRKQEAIQKQAAAENKNTLTISFDFTEEDFQSALGKLTEAAVKYNRNSAGTIGLDAFECESMLPHIFKEQLKRVFNIRLTPHELGAVMSYFDKNDEGSINCADFLIQFFRTGQEERSRIRRHWREVHKHKIEQKLSFEHERLKISEQRSLSQVNFDFTEENFDSALTKFVNLCYNFDRRTLGPAGFKAFESDTMTPSEFREMTKRTFGLKLSSEELGALVTYLDPNVQGLVSCQYFLNMFTQIRVKCEEFKGKPKESQKLQEYKLFLKESYQNRIKKLSTTPDNSALKPWRENSVLKIDRVAKKPTVKPTSAEEKLKCRIRVAKRSGRLDLSTCLPVDSSASQENNQVTIDPESTDEKILKLRPSQIKLTIPNPDNCPGAINLDLTNLSLALADIKNITELWLDNNIHLEAKSISIFTNFTNLSILSLNNVGLTEFPEMILTLKGLKCLYLQNNQIETVPEGIKELQALSEVNLSYNKLTQFPIGFCAVESLVTLDLSYNKINMIPGAIVSMVSLLILNLLGNGSVSISSHIRKRMPFLHILEAPTERKKSTGNYGKDSHANIYAWLPADFGISANEEKEILNLFKSRAKSSKEENKNIANATK